MNERARALLRALTEGLAGIYGDRLRGVYLYGSYARGSQDPESDLDVLIVLADFEHYGEELDRTSEIVAALSLEHGIASAGCSSENVTGSRPGPPSWRTSARRPSPRDRS